jgi:membrane-associated phospholipid phosphatase
LGEDLFAAAIGPCAGKRRSQSYKNKPFPTIAFIPRLTTNGTKKPTFPRRISESAFLSSFHASSDVSHGISRLSMSTGSSLIEESTLPSMNPQPAFHIGLRACMLWLALGSFGTLLCQPVAAQELSDELSSHEIMATNPAPDSAATAELAETPVPATQGVATRPDRCDILSALRACLDDVLHDQAGIWTSPARLHRRDVLWILPLIGTTAVAYHYDAATITALGAHPNQIRISNDFSNVGSGYALVGAAASIYAIGKIIHNERARETGIVALEALADASIVSEGLKLATDRFRPNGGAAAGTFWPDNTAKPAVDAELYTVNSSFPSGHAMATWAVMHVLVDETPGHRWLHVGLYALAAGVSVARVTGRNHFPSDVVVGSAIGYLVGGYVYRRRSQYYVPRLKAFSISPLYNQATRSYGVGISFVPFPGARP